MKLIVSAYIAADVAPQLPPDVQVIQVDNEGVFDGDPSDAEVFLRWWTPKAQLDKVLQAAPAIRWIHTPSAGVDHLLTPLMLSRDIVLTNNAGGHAIPIAEFVMAFILNHAKRLPALRSAQAERRWDRQATALELTDAVLLIVGMGGIGQAIATRAAAFGMRVWGSRRHPCDMPGVERVVGADGWRELLPAADYVVLAMPLTAETRRVFDAAALRSMRSSAYLINVARGAVIDEEALIVALREEWIAGAALDTFETEPLPPDSPLWDLPNVVLTPHCTSSSPRARQRSIALFLDNLERYRNGQPLRNVVDKAAGY